MHSKYGYRNTIDAFIKIWNEKNRKTRLGRVVSMYAKKNQNMGRAWFRIKMLARLKNFYSGGFYYSLAYISFISL